VTGRDLLDAAAGCVEQYHEQVREDLEAIPEAFLWERPVPGQVSAANLVLHLTGNLRHFFGHLWGGTSYRRERELEFQDGDRPERDDLLSRWDEACLETAGLFRGVDEGVLDRPAPVDRYPGGASGHVYLLRLLQHLSYHAGQIRSLRRRFEPGAGD
jgi:hypothetical protein